MNGVSRGHSELRRDPGGTYSQSQDHTEPATERHCALLSGPHRPNKRAGELPDRTVDRRYAAPSWSDPQMLKSIELKHEAVQHDKDTTRTHESHPTTNQHQDWTRLRRDQPGVMPTLVWRVTAYLRVRLTTRPQRQRWRQTTRRRRRQRHNMMSRIRHRRECRIFALFRAKTIRNARTFRNIGPDAAESSRPDMRAELCLSRSRVAGYRLPFS